MQLFYFLRNRLRFVKLLLLLFFSISSVAQAQSLEQNISQLLTTKSCVKCDFRNADLSYLDLSGVNIEAANLTGANLSHTNFRGANLSSTILLKVDLVDTKLAGANLKNADLSDQDIDETFEWVEIIGTQLEGAKFKDDIVCGAFPVKGGWGCRHL